MCQRYARVIDRFDQELNEATDFIDDIFEIQEPPAWEEIKSRTKCVQEICLYSKNYGIDGSSYPTYSQYIRIVNFIDYHYDEIKKECDRVTTKIKEIKKGITDTDYDHRMCRECVSYLGLEDYEYDLKYDIKKNSNIEKISKVAMASIDYIEVLDNYEEDPFDYNLKEYYYRQIKKGGYKEKLDNKVNKYILLSIYEKAEVYLLSILYLRDDILSKVSMLDYTKKTCIYRQTWLNIVQTFEVCIKDFAEEFLKDHFWKYINIFMSSKVALCYKNDKNDDCNYNNEFEFRKKIVSEAINDIKIYELIKKISVISNLDAGAVYECIARRNSHMHNSGVVDQKYMHQSNGWCNKNNSIGKITIGDYAYIDEKYYYGITGILKKYLNDLVYWEKTLEGDVRYKRNSIEASPKRLSIVMDWFKRIWNKLFRLFKKTNKQPRSKT